MGAFLDAGRPPTDEERRPSCASAASPGRGRWVLIGLAIAVCCMATASYWWLVL